MLKVLKVKSELIHRTKQYALDCWKFCFKVPISREYNAFVNQLIKSSSSVGAKSTADFINKLKIVEEEVDESGYWLEIFENILSVHSEEILMLQTEGRELLAITVASINTTKRNQTRK